MKEFNIAEWAIRHKQIIFFFIASILCGGLLSYFSLGRSEDPNFTIREMVVAASWPGASAKQITEQVTDPLERKLQDTEGLDYIKSFTHDGKTIIYVNLKDTVPKKEVHARWLQVRNLVNDEWSSMPSGVVGPFINDRFDDVYGSIYALTGDGFTYEEKRKYAEDIRRQLMSVKDVQKVELLGVQTQTIYVEMDQNKMAQFGISPSTVFQAIQQQGTMVPAGSVHTDTRNVSLRVSGLFNSPEALRNIPFHVGERVFHLSDVAEVTQTYEDPETSLMYFNGKPAIGIAVSMAPGGNNLTLGTNLEKKLVELRGQLPVGMEVERVADQPKVVNNSISEFTRSLVEAIIIVLIISFLSLGIRSGIVVALCIPVVVCATFLFMKYKGIDLHIVSLGSLIVALGLLVDDAIIVIEMMLVKLEQGFDRITSAEAAYRACAVPMLSGTLITAAGFIPVGLAAGETTEYTNSLFWVVSSALILSWLASVLVSPVIGYEIIRVRKKTPLNTAIKQKAYTIFSRLIRKCIHYRKTMVIATLLVFVGTLMLLPFMNREFFPSSIRPELILDMNLPSGASIQASKKVVEEVSESLYGDSRVSSFSSYIGDSAPRFILLFDPVAAEDDHAQMIIVANSTQARNSLRDDLQKMMAEKHPDVRIHTRFIMTGPPAQYPVMLRLRGPDIDTTADLAQQALAQMKTHAHIVNASLDWPEEMPSVQVNIDQNKIRALGADNYAVSQDLYIKLSGYKISESYQGDQLVPVKFRLSGTNAKRLPDLAAIPIHIGNGKYVPLGQFAAVTYGNETSTIWRRNLQPCVTLRAELDKDIPSDSITKDIYENTLKKFRENLPPGYVLEKDGTLEQSDISMNHIEEAVPWMIFIILMILMFQLQSIPLMVMAAITAPLGLIGSLLTLLITRQPLGFLAIIGMIALSGMIIRNSIILLDQIRQHREEGEDLYHAVVDAAVIRFRPIMLTAFAAVFGMVPLMGNPFFGPMAFAFSGGLLVATILTLFFLPALYCLYYKVEEPVGEEEEIVMPEEIGAPKNKNR